MVKLVQEYFIESAKRWPDRVAVNDGAEFTYKALDVRTNKLANAFRQKGVRRGDRVAFCLSKSASSVASFLAILKSGAAYVPMNTAAPAARIKQMIADAAPRLIICSDATADLVSGLGNIFNLDKEKSFVDSQSAECPSFGNEPGDLAYILYTSGSTGIPKGVMISHANIINATDWAVEEFGITEQDRMSQHPPLHFDLSTFDLYCAFKAGATLCIVPEELSLFPGALMKWIEKNQLTIWNSVPSVMVYMSVANLVKPGSMPTVRKIFFNGEGFPTKFLAEWMKAFPDKEFINMYGPTETTVQCTFYRVPEPPKDLTKLVPIGKACRNVEVFEVEGELYVAGAGVGLGYWNNPEKTAASFVEWPGKGRVYKTGDLVRLREDGNYEFIGRKDNQVKVMGNRIELGDVDNAISSLPYVNEAATIAAPDAETGGNLLVAFIDLKSPKPEAEIKGDLGKLLPPYMVPHKIVEGKLPKTSTGKIDRPKLKDEYRSKN